MELKFKNREKINLKKVMIYGNDGTGKSTYAETYCKEHKLKPVVIDIDDTNYTNLPILDLNFKTDLFTYNQIKNVINEIANEEEFDTIILDGVTSLLEMLVSKAKGLKKYSDRAERFQDILRTLLSSGKNIIFIGQADMEVIYNEEFQSNKSIIKVNSIVNEKYLCYKKKEGYSVKCVKYRELPQNPYQDQNQQEPVKAEPVLPRPQANNDLQIDDPEPVRTIWQELVKTCRDSEDVELNNLNLKKLALELKKGNKIDIQMYRDLIDFIDENCPEELE